MPPPLEPEPPERSDWFTTTHWSLVLGVGGDDSKTAQAALEDLCRMYYQPIFQYASQHGRSLHEAQDLTQAFFAHLLDKRIVAAADPERGRFRCFLLACFRNFAHHEWRRERAQKRGEKAKAITLDEVKKPADIRELSSQPPKPAESDYDLEWARTVLQRSLARLRAEHEKSGKIAIFDQFKIFLSQPGDQPAYAAAGEPLGMSAGAVSVAVHRLRNRCGELFQDEVARTVSRPEDVDDEMRYLMELLSR